MAVSAGVECIISEGNAIQFFNANPLWNTIIQCNSNSLLKHKIYCCTFKGVSEEKTFSPAMKWPSENLQCKNCKNGNGYRHPKTLSKIKIFWIPIKLTSRLMRGGLRRPVLWKKCFFEISYCTYIQSMINAVQCSMCMLSSMRCNLEILHNIISQHEKFSCLLNSWNLDVESSNMPASALDIASCCCWQPFPRQCLENFSFLGILMLSLGEFSGARDRSTSLL